MAVYHDETKGTVRAYRQKKLKDDSREYVDYSHVRSWYITDVTDNDEHPKGSLPGIYLHISKTPNSSGPAIGVSLDEEFLTYALELIRGRNADNTN